MRVGVVREGEETWSESAMVLAFTPDLANGLSLRISRYPDIGATWLWCHMLVDGRLFSFTERRLACRPDHHRREQARASYAVPGMDVAFDRIGSSGQLRGITFKASLNAHAGGGSSDGPGRVPITLEGRFDPARLRTGSPEGRFEHNGHVEARLSAGGTTVTLSEVAKVHEQTQTRPRFGPSFTYAMLWGPTASMVALMSKDRRYGDFEAGGVSSGIDRFRIETWAPRRRFIADLAGGRQVRGEAETVHRYSVPIFGRQWQGRIVRARADGHPMVGMINDWRGEEQPYGLTA
jgi:hypothetical protein